MLPGFAETLGRGACPVRGDRTTAAGRAAFLLLPGEEGDLREQGRPGRPGGSLRASSRRPAPGTGPSVAVIARRVDPVQLDEGNPEALRRAVEEGASKKVPQRDGRGHGIVPDPLPCPRERLRWPRPRRYRGAQVLAPHHPPELPPRGPGGRLRVPWPLSQGERADAQSGPSRVESPSRIRPPPSGCGRRRAERPGRGLATSGRSRPSARSVAAGGSLDAAPGDAHDSQDQANALGQQRAAFPDGRPPLCRPWRHARPGRKTGIVRGYSRGFPGGRQRGGGRRGRGGRRRRGPSPVLRPRVSCFPTDRPWITARTETWLITTRLIHFHERSLRATWPAALGRRDGDPPTLPGVGQAVSA